MELICFYDLNATSIRVFWCVSAYLSLKLLAKKIYLSFRECHFRVAFKKEKKISWIITCVYRCAERNTVVSIGNHCDLSHEKRLPVWILNFYDYVWIFQLTCSWEEVIFDSSFELKQLCPLNLPRKLVV